MKTIAVTSRKGGSGKTTLAVQVALEAQRRGLGVVVADTDPQRSSFEMLRAAVDERLQVMLSNGSKLATLQAACARAGTDLFIIDTPAVVLDEVAAAVGLGNLALLVARPTYLDLAAAAITSKTIRQLNKPGLVVMNQAPAPRRGVEAPVVARAMRAAEVLGLEVCPMPIRTRTYYQQAPTREAGGRQLVNQAARSEIAALFDLVQARLYPDIKAAPEAIAL